jgi:hypothetical protein
MVYNQVGNYKLVYKYGWNYVDDNVKMLVMIMMILMMMMIMMIWWC